jgi:hypothetical protein
MEGQTEEPEEAEDRYMLSPLPITILSSTIGTSSILKLGEEKMELARIKLEKRR